MTKDRKVTVLSCWKMMVQLMFGYFFCILRDVFEEETVEYVLALIDEMLAANPQRARLFHSESLANEDIYEPFLRLLWKGNYFMQEKSCKILAEIIRLRTQSEPVNGEESNSKKKFTLTDDVLKGLVEWLCVQVVMVVVLTFKNFLAKEGLGAQMVDLGLLQIVESLKAQAWSDEDLLDAVNQPEEGLRKNIKKLSSFEKYKQEILLGHLDWSPVHEDAIFWRENITSLEDNDFQILRVLIMILESSSEPRTLAVACFDLLQFIQCHPAGWIIATDLKAK